MTPKALSPNLSAAAQISPADVPAIAELGFRSIIGNRPDGEEPGQPDWAEIASAAQAAGLAAEHLPIASTSAIADADAAAFGAALERLPKPILAYCRTGNRSARLWALANNGSLTADERIRTGKRAGFDLEPLRGRMDRTR